MQTQTIENAEAEPGNASLKILIVDDDRHVRVLVKRTLITLGHEVAGEAKGGVEGIELFRQTVPDLVIMDVDMPILNGVDAAQAMLAIREVPVIFISGFWDDATLKRVKQLSAAAYLTKPFSPAQLNVAVALAVPEPTP